MSKKIPGTEPSQEYRSLEEFRARFYPTPDERIASQPGSRNRLPRVPMPSGADLALQLFGRMEHEVTPRR
jgi:hypothetical protein